MDWHVGIIGAGTIGKSVGKAFDYVGYPVTFYDNNWMVASSLKQEGFMVADSLEELVIASRISFICVPTPTVDGYLDKRYIEEVLINLLLIAKRNDMCFDYHVAVVKSTVIPTVVDEILRANAYHEVSNRLGIAVSPEFVRGKVAFLDFFRLPFMIVSGYTDRAKETLKRFYEDFKKKSGSGFEIIETDPTTAFLAKYVSNCLLSCKISFFNEIAKLCQRLDVNPYDIVKLALTDRYPTNYWYLEDFLREGFRDECLPKDLDALLSFSNDVGVELKLLQTVREINYEKILSREDIRE